ASAVGVAVTAAAAGSTGATDSAIAAGSGFSTPNAPAAAATGSGRTPDPAITASTTTDNTCTCSPFGTHTTGATITTGAANTG
ncbi:hypothetical protein, partial [Mycobacterium marinum]|uniref:hypothetical protein n=1 Tax=Mycobacterium marinum TaxID=1781 RepID=UPI0035667BE5